MKEKIPIYISIFVFILIFILALIIPNINFFKKKNNDDNLDNPFYIKKQILYSGIMPKSTSFYENSFNLSVSQYTDIAIYLGTKNSELTDSNTIQSLYLDKITFEPSPILGSPALYYQNPTKFATDSISSDYLIDNHLRYNILNFDNKENYNYYSTPNFFTDCSIPITLKYLNSDIIKNYKVPDMDTLEFDGRVLRDSNINLSDLSTSVKFDLNIVTNTNKLYTFNISVDIPLSDENSTIFDKNIYIKK